MQANLQNIFQKSLPTTMESEIANPKIWYAYGIAARCSPLHGWNNCVTVALKIHLPYSNDCKAFGELQSFFVDDYGNTETLAW